MKYSEKLKDPRWIAKSQKIKQRDNFVCQRCGNSDHLNAHHIRYITGRDPWDYPDNYLITLCKYCHEEEHYYQSLLNNKIDSMMLSGMLTHEIAAKFNVNFNDDEF